MRNLVHRPSVWPSLFASLASGLVATGCGPDAHEQEPAGAIAANLVSPVSGCAKFDVVSDVRNVSKSVAVQADVSTTVQIPRVPLTHVTVSGEIYTNADCSGAPLFAAEGVGVDLSPESPNAEVTLKFLGLGGLTINSEIEGSCSKRTVVASPPPSALHAMAYFKKRKETLLVMSEGDRMAVYAFKFPKTWTRVEIDPASAPPARNDPALAFDEASGKIVMFGGDDGSPLDDLWEFDGCAWQARTPESLPVDWPTPRWGAASAFDPVLQSVIITTGVGIAISTTAWESAPADASVFEWHTQSGTFTKHPGAGTPPSNRGAAVAVTDTNRGVVYLADGVQEYGAGDSAWYRWDGATRQWSTLALESNPPPRASAAMFFDPVLDAVALTGGQWYGWSPPEPGFSSVSPASGSVSSLSGEQYNRFWAPIAFDTDNNVGIQFGGIIAAFGDNPGPLSDTRLWSGGGSVETVPTE